MRIRLLFLLLFLSVVCYAQTTTPRLDSLLTEINGIELPVNNQEKFERLTGLMEAVTSYEPGAKLRVNNNYLLFEEYMESAETWAKSNLSENEFNGFQIERFRVNERVRNSNAVIRLGYEIINREEEIYDRKKSAVVSALRGIYVELEAYTELIQLQPYIDAYSRVSRYPEDEPYLEFGLNNDLAMIYYNMKNYTRAIEEFTKIAELKGDENGTLWSASNYNNIGLCYFHLGDLKKSRATYILAMEELKKGPFHEQSSQNFASIIEGNLAEIDLKEGRYDQALRVFLKEIDVTRKDEINNTSAYMNIGEAYLGKGNREMAMIYLDSCVASFNRYTSVQNQLDGLELRADVLLWNGDMKGYHEDTQMRRKIMDSIEQLRASRQNAIAIAKFQSEEKDKELLESKETIARKEKRTFWIASGLILLFLSFLYFYNRSKNKALQIKLIKRVDEQTKEILRQKERLEELASFKSKLYTNITHEFRTPLTVILGMSEQLETGFKTLPPSKAKEKLSFIKRNGSSLLNLVNQMLDLSKMENNELKTHYIQGDIVVYIRYVSESFHSHANARNVMLKVESRQPEIIMDYDPEKLRQILSNLLSNAIKYTPSGGKVLIRVDVEADEMLLTVEDTGLGIAIENQPHIFDRFYQADDAVSKTGGTGIGLALTKELVVLMSGTIHVESVSGQGSTFTVLLPISNNAPIVSFEEELTLAHSDFEPLTPQQETIPSTTSGISGKPRLLIVEDNLDVVEYISSCLEEYYELDFAYNGQAGIDLALENTPEIVLSDVMMPEKDGFELCEVLKNDPRSSHIPIVLLTAKADVESKIAGLRQGADAYLKKPFHEEELHVVLDNLLQNRKMLQAKYTELATQFPKPSMNSSTKNSEDAFIIKLRAILDHQLGNSFLKVEEVCKEIGMGRTNLYGKLRAITGMSFNIYLRTLRLHKARELLNRGDLNISEIAYEVGFNDPKYFSRIFSEEFGMPPSKYNS